VSLLHTRSCLSSDIEIIKASSADTSQESTLAVWPDRIWRHHGGLICHILSGHTARVDSCDVSADDAFIISMSDDKQLRVWSSDTGNCLLVLNGHTNTPFLDSCTFSKSDQTVASITRCGETKVWSITTGLCIKTVINISDEIGYRAHRICYLSAERLVWWNDRRVGIWDMIEHRNIHRILVAYNIRFVRISADDQYIIIILKLPPLVLVYSFKTLELII
jgi:WD40 repeat protein